MGQTICSCDDDQDPVVSLIIKEEDFQEENLIDVRILAQNFIEQKIEIPGEKTYVKKQVIKVYFAGQFVDGLAEGMGLIYQNLNCLYYGKLKAGLFEGDGYYYNLKAGRSYKGQFKNGHPHGNGVFNDRQKGLNFNGEWQFKNDLDHSVPIKGDLSFESDKELKSVKFYSIENRDCVIHYNSGAEYQGFIDLNRLIPHGVGKMIFCTNDVYQGEWQGGKFHGAGVYTWRSGEKYTGNYSEGLRHGKGVYLFKNGRHFRGNWQKGKKHGDGVLVSSEGITLQKVEYESDRLVEKSDSTLERAG